MEPFRILFVCHGNICRSPMAEFVMKDIVRRHGDEALFDIASAATHTDEIGSPVHSGTIEMLLSQGVPIEDRKARRLRTTDYKAWHLLVCMDDANMKNMAKILGGDSEAKMHKLLEYAGSDNNIADPWYTGDFRETYDDVVAGCTGLYRFLRSSQ